MLLAYMWSLSLCTKSAIVCKKRRESVAIQLESRTFVVSIQNEDLWFITTMLN